jgi:hypothetical protein
MPKVFLSLRFDDEFNRKLAEKVRNELRHYGLECVIAGDLTRAPPPEVIRSTILACDALLAIITPNESDWIQNEIGIAYAGDMPVYALVQEGVKVGGLLPRITSYVHFTRSFWESDVKRSTAVIASEVLGLDGLLAVIEPTDMLTTSTGKLTIAIRPRKLPSGEEIITIYVPHDFNVPINEDHITTSAVGPAISSEIPTSACRIAESIAKKGEPLAGFLKIELILLFPEISSYLRAGWAEFRIRYTAPEVAGKYRFYGSDQVSIGGKNSRRTQQDSSSFDLSPIFVKGEVTPVSLTGIIFTSEQTPLRRSGVVRAEMTMRVDPYTGQDRRDLPTPGAVCYLSAKDDGKYQIYGLAPGIYNVLASAFGSPESLIASGLKIQAGMQPASLDGYVKLS